MVVDITNEILTHIKNTLIGVEVLTSYPENPTNSYPVVIVEESDNSAYMESKDSGGFHHSNIAFRIEIYTKGNKKMSDAKTIRNQIDGIMSDQYGMARGTPMVVPNFLDNTIYRYVINYRGRIDENKIIFRG